MTLKDKLILTLLSIITFGIYPLFIFNKKNTSTKASLSQEKSFDVDLNKLREHLGTIDNIMGIEFTHTKIKITVHAKEKVDVEAISKLKGISGVFATSKSVTLIVGNSAKAISEQLV